MPSHDVSLHRGHGAPTPSTPPTPPAMVPVEPGPVVDGAEPHGGHGNRPETTRSPGLDPVASGAGHATGSAKIATLPARPVPGVPFRVDIHVRDREGRPIDPEIVHERPIHLLLISDDLADFQHLHPERRGTGHYALDVAVPRGRTYRAFAEYTAPGSDAATVTPSTIGTSGPSSPRAPLAIDLDAKHIDRTVVELGGTSDIRRGEEASFTVTVRDATSGARATDLRPWLGAPAHGVIVDRDLRGLVHAHAMSADERSGSGAQMSHPTGQNALGEPASLVFHARFERSGLHKIWVQFDRAGEVITAPFVVDVR